MLRVAHLQKSYRTPPAGRPVTVLDIPVFTLGPGEVLGLRGHSGSGKTTFLHCLAGLILPEGGEVRCGETVVNRLPESARDRWRARHLGYIHQTFNLLQGLTVLENVLLGMTFGGTPIDRPRALHLLEEVGLAAWRGHYPRQLSVGQQQRVAVARALVASPRLVLADEPTGSLDPRHARLALELVQRLCRDRGAALLLVSHQPEILAQMPTVRDFAEFNRAAAEVPTP